MPEEGGVHTRYAIGTPDKAWSAEEQATWLSQQSKKRDYFTDVVSPLMRLDSATFEVFQYGALDYQSLGGAHYPLYAVKNRGWSQDKPLVLVTGGVHGYETSGVHGALLFIQAKMTEYADRVNVLVLPCVSPWGYETVNRWSPLAVDPNRQFVLTKPGCGEAAHAMACILVHAQQSSLVLQHTDLHETTDSDNSEFTPAKAARDGRGRILEISHALNTLTHPYTHTHAPHIHNAATSLLSFPAGLAIPVWEPIPDGFYLIGDVERPQLGWHRAMIAAVKEVTHIAPPDSKNEIVGEKVVDEGILICPSVGDCGCHTSALYCTTTEVYPDSSRTSPDECNRAQLACIVGGLDFALKEQGL